MNMPSGKKIAFVIQQIKKAQNLKLRVETLFLYQWLFLPAVTQQRKKGGDWKDDLKTENLSQMLRFNIKDVKTWSVRA